MFASQPERSTRALEKCTIPSKTKYVSCLRNSKAKHLITKKMVHWDDVIEHVSLFDDEDRDLISGTEEISVPLKTLWPGTESNSVCSGRENQEESQLKDEQSENLSNRRQSIDFVKLRKDIERVKINQNLERRSRSTENVNQVLCPSNDDKAKHDSLPSNLNSLSQYPAVTISRFVVKRI